MTQVLSGMGSLISSGEDLGLFRYSIVIRPGERGNGTLDGAWSLLKRALEEAEAELKIEDGRKASIIIHQLSPVTESWANFRVTSAFLPD